MGPSDFANLEVGETRQEGAGFWPTFADLMTVVVIVFLLALVVLVIRNWELIESLRQANVAAEQAAKTATERLEENLALSHQLSDREGQLAYLQMRLMELQEELDAQARVVEQQTATLSELEGSYAELQNRNVSIQSELDRLQTEEQQWGEQRRELEAALSAQGEELSAVRSELSVASEEMGEYQRQLRAQEERLALKNVEYTKLKEKYDKLVKPARTTKGKEVVEVLFDKRGGEPIIQIRRPGSAVLERVSRQEMHQVLQDLKAEHPKTLYVKITFPESASVSHGEAWTFTSELLRKYDYYYQE